MQSGGTLFVIAGGAKKPGSSRPAAWLGASAPAVVSQAVVTTNAACVSAASPQGYFRKLGNNGMNDSATDVGRQSKTVLAFRLSESLHALPIESVEEVLPSLPIEAISQCPEFVLGVVFVRGHLIPIFDAAERLGMKNHARMRDPHIVCLRWEGRLVGVEVDEVLDLIEIHPHQTLPAQALNASGGFLAEVVEHRGEIIRILDPDRLVALHEAAKLEVLPRTVVRERH